MEKYIINGGKPLFGEVDVPCAKNAYLAILAGCVLSSGVVKLKDCPNFEDINNMLEILSDLGAKIVKNKKDIVINCKTISKCQISTDLAHKIRSSIFLLGPILARLKKAIVCYPGGCDIGARPIDLHLKGLRSLNAKISESYGLINCEAQILTGDEIHLDYPSVGATENIMMAAVLAKGTTKIHNAAKEPEIIDLQNFLNKMGAKITGAGSDTINIEGVKKLGSVEYKPIPDRIIAGTYLIAVACCGGEVLVKNVESSHISSIISKLKTSGCKFDIKSDSIKIVSHGRLKSFKKLQTLPYPGFPTDLQPQALVLQSISNGTCMITENLFETRFKHVPELVKMGADISVQDRTAYVTGVKKLYGAEVSCSDLRAGAALTIAGLVAEGTTIVHNIKNIDRGYEFLEKAFKKLGADIQRI
ncbi:MAG: UDP-N-acetylglucosamine 1-carboxyvinyltransferase [Clostridia bacterium]|nr:UDP-N-acetylglucosamine 1-carboxyvinyltransferase [Clostridia bacterium]